MMGNAFLIEEINSYCLTVRKIISTIIVFIAVGLLIIPHGTDVSAIYNSNMNNHEMKSQTDFIIKNHEVFISLPTLEQNLVEEKLEVNNPNNLSFSAISFWFNQTVENITIEDGEGILLFDITEIANEENNLTIYLRENMHFNSNTTLYITYSLSETPFFELGKDYYFFQFRSSISYYTERYSISIILPYGSVIHYEKGIESLIPPTEARFLRDRVYIEWVFYELDASQNQIVSVFLDIVDRKLPIWAFIIGPILGIGVGVGSSFYFMRRRQRKSMRKLGDVFLTDTQKELVKIVLDNDGRILQKELCEKTGYSKSNVSRTLIPLEEQGIIKREKKGRNYIIYLTETGYKVIE